MSRTVDWYFDYVSPFPYLQLARFDSEMKKIIRPRPILFAALLDHWGHKGPAEIPSKARHTYYLAHWLAKSRSVPFLMPPRHPFNPLALLRLTLSLGAGFEVVEIIYRHVWGQGNDGQSADSLAALGEKLGVDDLETRTGDPAVKEKLKQSTAHAIERGVFGVPTLFLDGRLFWGEDATDMFRAYLKDPGLFDAPEFKRIEAVKPAAARRGA